ncbi:hypothetical protein M758_8G112700 [Ceratodon purpureus]|nr:hypothetical protein M758_8G112700 [Ceratodon purpureus]
MSLFVFWLSLLLKSPAPAPAPKSTPKPNRLNPNQTPSRLCPASYIISFHAHAQPIILTITDSTHRQTQLNSFHNTAATTPLSADNYNCYTLVQALGYHQGECFAFVSGRCMG